MMATALAATGDTPVAATSPAVMATLPMSETTPLAATKAANWRGQAVVRRSRHVHRRCHAKLWPRAVSTAAIVAGRWCTPAAVSSASAPSCTPMPAAPTT